jgi:RNA polymerase sigma factor (sigma-70 family)
VLTDTACAPIVAGWWCDPRSDAQVLRREAGILSPTSVDQHAEAAFEKLVRVHRRVMMATVWRVTRDSDLAQDAFQEALATIWRKLPLIERHPNPQALILRICLGKACDLLRARLRQRRRDAPLDEASAALVPSPGKAIEGKAVAAEVLAAIARLGSKQAIAVLLHVVHEQSYEAIGQALSCSETTARVHALRGREKLKRWLSHLSGEEER